VRYFGRVRDAAGAAELNYAPPSEVKTIAELRDWLGLKDAALGEALKAAGVRVARDQQICAPDALIAGAEEIAFMAPFSGG
jgi:molybdopterin synthase sulfur carrier subunit